MKNFSYLSPSSKVNRIQSTNSYVFDHQASDLKVFNQMQKRRKIFDLPPEMYQDYELQALQKIKQYLKLKNPSKTYSDSLLLKYCYLGKFMTSQSVEKYHYYEDWHALPNCSKDKEKGILHSGVFYTYGKDQSYCPTIYFHPSRINLQKFEINDYFVCLRSLLKPVQEHMLIPGKVQHWNVVVDLRDCQQKKIKNIYEQGVRSIKKIMYAYPYRLKKLFIIVNKKWKKWDQWPGKQNFSQVLTKKLIFDLNITGLERKLKMIQSVKDLDLFIPEHEREQQYGGQLQNLCQFWPIQTTNKLVEVNSGFQDLSMDSQEYLSINNAENQSFFKDQEQRDTICDFKSCSLI